MVQYLSSNIFSAGTKFVVNNKTTDSTFGPGTTGIMGYVRGVDINCLNVAYIHVVILKRGNQGKPRLGTELISTPIFNFKGVDSSTIMPDKKQKHYVHTESGIFSNRTIYEMDALDYLGWALSLSSYLYKLSKYTKPLHVWPTADNNIMNIMLNISSFWNEDSSYAIDRFCAPEICNEFINQMRIIESTLIDCSLSYILKISKLQIDAINYLTRYNNKKTEICNKKILDKTLSIFTNRYKGLTMLKKKNVSALKGRELFLF